LIFSLAPYPPEKREVTKNGKGGMSKLDNLLMSLSLPPILNSIQLTIIVLAKELKQSKKTI